MTPKKTKKAASKKQAAEKHSETTVAGDPAGAQVEKPVAMIIEGAAPTDGTDGSEIVVFAFRLTRGERDEIHAATGSAKASKFIRTLALAGARGDMKAVQEAIDEVQATSK